MDLEKPPAERPVPRAEGCLTVAVRLPVRIVVLVLVVPVRVGWDALAVGGRLLRDSVLRPAGRALSWVAWAVFVWPWVTLWRYVVVPAGRMLGRLGYVLLVVPAVRLYDRVLTPLGQVMGRAARGTGAVLVRALRGSGAGLGLVYAWLLVPVGRVLVVLLEAAGTALVAVGLGAYRGVAWLTRYLIVVPAVWCYAWVLTPVGRAAAWTVRRLGRLVWMIFGAIGTCLYWTARILLVLPALAVWRGVLVPVGRVLAVVGRETAEAFGHAWRVAGHVSLAVGRFLARLLRLTFVEPVRWTCRTLLIPFGQAVRDTVLRPAAEAARGVGRITRRTLAAARESARQTLAAARESARQAGADVRRTLFGAPREPGPLPRPEPRGEPGAAAARTLGSRTTALTKD
ncbi:MULTISPECIES: hypothetical protein [unclassified Streptomyces]|uniref:hypothetical protein n=1 Tax=unclassified Streptomyces TaxID=2593676 RepID=UPI002E2FF06A|nr:MULTISPECIES: hypothetical protein [unclassified Streptomyces]